MSITPTGNTNPIGTLSLLPPELRDQIYDHVLDASYVVFWTSHRNDGHASPDGVNPTVSADLEVLHVSKALGAEAGARLFSNATVFAYLIRFDGHDRLSRPPPKGVTEKMMNVEFVIDTGAPLEGEYVGMIEDDVEFYERSAWGDDMNPVSMDDGKVRRPPTVYRPATMDPRCEASVDHFTGTAIERNNLLVTFRDFDENFHLFTATRFFQTLKECVGFRTVTMGLEWWQLDGWVANTTAVAEKVEGLRVELEQCWGPCVVRDVFDQYTETTAGPDMKLCFAFELAFQPRKCRGENLKAGAVGVMKEGDGAEEVS